MFFQQLALINAVDHKVNNLPSQQAARAVHAEVVTHEEKKINGRASLFSLIESTRYEECHDETVIAQTRTAWARTFFSKSVEVSTQLEAEMETALALAEAA